MTILKQVLKLRRYQQVKTTRQRSKSSLGFENLESRRLMAVTSGDFDGDGIEDMAVGLPGADASDAENAGRVEIVYGTDNGLAHEAAPEVWHRRVDGNLNGARIVSDLARPRDRFGEVLAAGDFNNDGADDLAIGAPNDDVNGIRDAGSINVIYGLKEQGLHEARNQIWHQDSWNIADRAERFDHFGATLAVGNFNGDDYDDLAIAAPGENLVVEFGLIEELQGHVDGVRESAGIKPAWNWE